MKDARDSTTERFTVATLFASTEFPQSDLLAIEVNATPQKLPTPVKQMSSATIHRT